MFLFKCCSNHSLPNFLKSTKTQASSVNRGQQQQQQQQQQLLQTPTSLNGRCSNEALDDLSSGVDAVDIVEAEEVVPPVERRSECERRIVINPVRRAPVEFHSSSSNSIALLVGGNRVETSLFKRYSSCDSAFNPDNRKHKNGRRRVANDGKAGKSPASVHARKSFVSDGEELFRHKSGQEVNVERIELLIRKFPLRRKLPAEDFQSFLLRDEKRDSGISERSADLPELSVPHDCSCMESTDSRSVNISKLFADSNVASEKSPCDDEKQFLDGKEAIPTKQEKSRSLTSPEPTFNTNGIQSESSGGGNWRWRGGKEPYLIKRDCFIVECDDDDDDDSHPIAIPSRDGENSERSLLESPSQEIHVGISTDVGRPNDERANTSGRNYRSSLIQDSSIDVLLDAGEKASFLEEFLPREGDRLFLPVHFAIANDSSSPSSSEDSMKVIDDESTSVDSLLSDKTSNVTTVFRPCEFKESQIIFSDSPDAEPSDESVQNNSGNNSMTDSLLGSPEYPTEGLDFRHFYSKSLPNLDTHPYDGISSLGLIEEYFSRYVIESNDGEGKCFDGSKVDPVSPNSSDEPTSVGEKTCLEDYSRQHSLGKLTEICKKFSSTYLNFLQSTRESECANEVPVDRKLSDARDHESQQEADDSALKLTALYAAMFPRDDKRELHQAKTPATDDNSECIFPSRKPSLAGRSVSLRETPGAAPIKVAKKKKVVKFADSFGLELAIVRLILSGENLSDQDFHQRFQTSGIQHCNNSNSSSSNGVVSSGVNNDKGSKNASTKQTETRKIVSTFVQPGNSEDFFQRVEAQNVILESCLPEEKGRSVSGCIRVKNLSYEKAVRVRYTLNDWLSYNETSASYVFGSSDGRSDRFSFSIKLPSFFDIGSAIEFAIVYRTRDGAEFWDNNGGLNYRMTCRKC